MKWLPLFLIVSCTNPIPADTVEYSMELDGRLEMKNGYYELELNPNSNQTLHRISGELLKNGEEPYPPEKVSWTSSHYWILTDTIGYVVRRTLVRGVWVNVDTSWVSGFSGQTVPTVNGVSYSGRGGEINTMIAPIYKMKGDTMVIQSEFGELRKTIRIILK